MPGFLQEARGMLKEAALSAADVLWPERCVGCDKLGTLLCDTCAASLPRIDQTWACPHCGAPYGWLLCTECLETWEEPLRVVSAFAFEGVAPKLITVYKDEHERRLAPLLAQSMVEALTEARILTTTVPVDAIAFIPSTPAALMRRGFDPMLGVARELGRLLHLPVAQVLVHHNTRDQRELGRKEREDNVAGSFEVVGEVWESRLLLIDDVVTTGASLRSAAQALRAGGANVPWAASVARVW